MFEDVEIEKEREKRKEGNFEYWREIGVEYVQRK